MLQHISAWNGWLPEKLLNQFAGDLHGKAFQEWNLMNAR